MQAVGAGVAVGQTVAGVAASFSDLKKMDSLPGCLGRAPGLPGLGRRSRAVLRAAPRRATGARSMARDVAELELEPASAGSPLLGRWPRRSCMPRRSRDGCRTASQAANLELNFRGSGKAELFSRPPPANVVEIHWDAVPRQIYCETVHKTIRRKTSPVMIGNVGVGSDFPIRVQTMTTTDTKDVQATVEQVRFFRTGAAVGQTVVAQDDILPPLLQVMRIADKGADIVRITVQGKKEADACYEIKDTLVKKGCVWLITDGASLCMCQSVDLSL